MITEKGERRLRRLAAFLETLDAKVFDLETWMCRSDSSPCGTTACAVGWACTLPEFQEEGLQIGGYPLFINRETGRIHNDWDAVYQFFEIYHPLAHELFMSESYTQKEITPAMVAMKIDMCLALSRTFRAVMKAAGISHPTLAPQSPPEEKNVS